jgi:hypothetical protein
MDPAKVALTDFRTVLSLSLCERLEALKGRRSNTYLRKSLKEFWLIQTLCRVGRDVNFKLLTLESRAWIRHFNWFGRYFRDQSCLGLERACFQRSSSLLYATKRSKITFCLTAIVPLSFAPVSDSFKTISLNFCRARWLEYLPVTRID